MPRNSWSVVSNAFESIVSRETFQDAQRILQRGTYFQTNERLLDMLRKLWAEKGKLTQKLISKAKNVPSTGTFWWRFGGLRNAYRQIGYFGIQSSPDITATRQRLATVKKSLLGEIVKNFPEEVSITRKNWRQRPLLRLTDNSLITVYLCRQQQLSDGSLRWRLDTVQGEVCRLSLVARMDGSNNEVFDFHLLPGIRTGTRLTLAFDDPRLLKGVRFKDVAQFLSAAKNLISRNRARG